MLNQDLLKQLRTVSAWYELSFTSNETVLGDWRASGSIQFDLLLIRDVQGHSYLQITSKNGSLNSMYGQNQAIVGLFDGAGDMFGPDGLFVGKNRHYGLNNAFLQNHQKHTGPSTVAMSPKTFREKTGTISTTTGTSWNIGFKGMGGGSEEKGAEGAGEFTFGYENSKSRTRTRDVFNFNVQQGMIGPRPIWTYQAGDYHDWNAYQSLPMDGEVLLAVDQPDRDSLWKATLFFAGHCYKRKDRNAFACGAATIAVDFNKLDIYRDGKRADVVLEPKVGLPFQTHVFSGNLDKLLEELHSDPILSDR